MRLTRRAAVTVTAAATTVAALAATAVGISAASAATSTTPLATLQAQVSQALAGTPASSVAAYASVAGLGDVAVSPTTASRPASNEKLLTTIAALDQIGPGATFTTTLSTDAPVRADGVVLGDLIVHGSGDPSIDDARLGALAQQVASRGIRHFTGRLYVDDSRYAQDSTAPGWQPGFLPTESGPISAFAIDNNTRLTSAAYLASPTLGNAELLRAALAAHGVTVAGGDVSGEPTVVAGFSWIRPVQQVVASTTSGSLASLVTPMLKESVNWYAEMLLHELGAHSALPGTRAGGVAAVDAEANRLNVPVGSVYDGSGLSYDDAETPVELVDWLTAAHARSFGSTLYNALPVSCVDGTLQYRLCGSYLTGRIHAKTGTLSGVLTLSGYTETVSGRFVVFSVMMSGSTDWTTSAAHMDAAVAALARFDQ